jgi:hypothetical protein
MTVAVPEFDQRFVRIRRPLVIVGGELTLDQLELAVGPARARTRPPRR